MGFGRSNKGSSPAPPPARPGVWLIALKCQRSCLRTYLRTYLRSSLRSRLHYCRSSDADRSRSCAQPLHRRRAPSRRLHRHR
jgi:hypothetical protein